MARGPKLVTRQIHLSHTRDITEGGGQKGHAVATSVLRDVERKEEEILGRRLDGYDAEAPRRCIHGEDANVCPDVPQYRAPVTGNLVDPSPSLGLLIRESAHISTKAPGRSSYPQCLATDLDLHDTFEPPGPSPIGNLEDTPDPPSECPDESTNAHADAR